MYTINIWAILVAAVVSFVIGAIWYSPVLFGKEWMALMKISDSDITPERKRGMWKSYLVQFIMSIVMYGVLGFIIAATGTISGSDGAFLAFLVWLGFVVPIGISGLLWNRDPFKLFLINTINMLVTMVVGGGIIGAWH